MIPKIIHYCWLSSDPVPDKFKEYLKSWKEKLPDYELMLWNFERFDIHSSEWVREAFESKKYAFAADYIRLHALYTYGGIYLDCDIEVLKPFDPFLHLSSMLCYEKDGIQHFEMAAFGVQKHSFWVKECLAYYQNRRFIVNGKPDMKILPLVINEVLTSKFKLVPVKDIKEASAPFDDPWEIRILPHDYFSPKSYWTGKLHLTDNTVCIHHFSSSWISSYYKKEAWFWEYLGLTNLKILEKITLKAKLFRLNYFGVVYDEKNKIL